MKQDVKPNIIVILKDNRGCGDFCFNGNKQLKTLNLDGFTANGAMFTNGYENYAVCSSSRAGRITGRFQEQFDYNRNPLLN